MIRTDFIDGGFPISRRSPVICTDTLTTEICYNRFELKKFIEKHENPNTVYMGIWPGKKSTDGFLLRPDAYEKHAPPEEHKDIDSAESISIIFTTNSKFSSIIYVPGLFAENRAPVLSKDKSLYEYVRDVGLKYKSVIGEEA